MLEYKKLNKFSGYTAFIIALIVYSITVEDTASFWDAGEFIAVSSKLEVPHPPGAPFYLLLGRFFSMFAFGVPENIAIAINLLSVVSSALTILFLFWTITYLIKKVIDPSTNKPISQEELGLRTGNAKKTIGEIERGNTNPTFETLFKIARELKVPIIELFNYSK